MYYNIHNSREKVAIGEMIVPFSLKSKGVLTMKEYNPVTAKDLIIVGNYQEKAEAPIYFGTFKVATSAYDSANTTQYFDEEKLGTKYYDSVTVSECVGDGAV